MAAAAAMFFASCTEDTNNGNKAEETQVVIKLSGVVPSATRTVDNPGLTATGTIQLSNGHIFVITPTGNVVHDEALDPTDARSSAGQRLTQQVPSDSRVYIVGNIPTDAATALPACTTFSQVQAAVSAISTQNDAVDKYKTAALANKTGQPSTISQVTAATSTDPAVYLANITLTPLISRLELVSVIGGANSDGDAITAFKVTGVFLDDDYPQFTYGGSSAGTQHQQFTNTNFTGVTGDTGSWAATTVGSDLIATPGTGKVWAYNVTAGSITRLIIRLEDVKWKPSVGAEIDLTGTVYYLTVTSYSGITSFARGTIYRIGVTDENEFEFNPDDLELEPNPINVLLDVKVAIEEWTVLTPGANL